MKIVEKTLFLRAQTPNFEALQLEPFSNTSGIPCFDTWILVWILDTLI